MRKSLYDKLCCPMDKSDLHLRVIKETGDGEIRDGLLTCPVCSRYFPIISGIPILTPDEYREKSLENPVLNKWGIPVGEDSGRFFLEESFQ